jgi:hypothetical protein
MFTSCIIGESKKKERAKPGGHLSGMFFASSNGQILNGQINLKIETTWESLKTISK